MRTILAALVVVLCAAHVADAGRIPVLYQSGRESFESGPLPAPYDQEPELAGWSAGYVCDVVGIFYTYFAIDDCRPAAIQGNNYHTDDKLAAAIRKAYPDESIPFWSKHGWKLLFGMIVLATVAAVLMRQRDDEDDEAVTQPVRTVHAVDPDDIEGLTERVRDPEFYKRRRVVASNSLQYGVTQPLVQPKQPPPAPPRRAARGSYTERDYDRIDAAHTQLGWQPSSPRASKPRAPK